MISNLLLHPQTSANLQRYLGSPSHGLLIIGSSGAGKARLAQAIAAQILQVDQAKLPAHPYVRQLEPQHNTIPIEAVRSVQEFLRLKTTGRQTWRRAILIHDASQLTIEAQNALLKLLEEPPHDTLILLTVQRPQMLLPTIVSRLAQLTIKALPLDTCLSYFIQQGYTEAAIKKAYYISKGLPGLMSSLLAEEQAHPLLQQITLAKQLLSQSAFDRLAEIDKLAKQKDQLPNLLWALQRVADAALYQAAQKQNHHQIHHWQQFLTELLNAQRSLSANPQPKLLLTSLFLSF